MRAGQGRGAATDRMVMSAPVVSCQAVFTGLAAARKNRRARSVWPPARLSRSAAASSAATDMPCP